ncbi:MAG: hypothetical protein KGJ23_07960 [Euryarchaeota archaeon]|nr:hypothetical protein [Euryarchaeota archaeon]MDE1836535.1 hypothetical protein [Euryarchaeota archaeon]MDE1879270.1 hypothetical protein [Euryarchaeota archaeon]MDE2044505.1 hypothetical protein [Thermoplasmata archaeon]
MDENTTADQLTDEELICALIEGSIGGGGPDNEDSFAAEIQRLGLVDAWVELEESPHDGHIWSDRFDKFCRMVDQRA